jgi:hypothetical protein
MEEGSESALKDYYRKCQDQLDELVKLTIGDLSKGDRKKVITLCTIDTHARDVVQKLIDEKVETASAFQWQSQLRWGAQHLSDFLICLATKGLTRQQMRKVHLSKSHP